MKSITDERIRWRIMIGLGTDIDGEPISFSWARETALNIANHLDSFNIEEGTGTWRGKQEPSLVLEYIADDTDKERVKLHVIAETIAKYLNQAQVWVTEEPVVLTRIIR